MLGPIGRSKFKSPISECPVRRPAIVHRTRHRIRCFHRIEFADQCMLHLSLSELLGHGTGRQLQENADGTFNFDRDLINPLTGKPVESWYKPGETYSAKIGVVSSSMEECRAESVGKRAS